MKRAMIIGCAGQDGRLLFDHLAADGYELLGVGKNGIRAGAILPGDFPESIDIFDAAQVALAVGHFAPHEVYYLPAYHHSAEDSALADTPELFRRSYAAHVTGLLNFLEAMRSSAPQSRLFYAASSHVFGDPPTPVQDESTPLNPKGIYGITKTAGAHCCRFYRHAYGIHASVGFLYNHESALRQPQFLSQKIVRSAVAIRRGMQSELILGDLLAATDWGYAPDYVRAMHAILQQDTADDFVVATGIPHTVRDFVTSAFAAAGVDPAGRIREDRSILIKPRVQLVGDAGKLRRLTGWKPSVDFREMVEILVRHEARRTGLVLGDS